MKNLVTGLMVAALVAAASSAQARGKQSDRSSSQSGASSSQSSQYGSSQSGMNQSGQSSGMTGSSMSQQGQDARTLIKSWPQVSQQAAQSMLDRYGQPDVVSGSLLVWNDKTPFRKIMVTKDGVRHLFPAEHQDVLTQEINLAVPLDKVEDLARFDGSLLIDRTKGTVAARSDSESSNFLALNLADDIINGKRDVASARKFYADTLAKQMSGKSSAYTDKLNFSVSGDTTYPDSSSGSSSGSSGSMNSGGSSSESQDIGNPSSPSGTSPSNTSPSGSSPSENVPSEGQ